MFPLVKLLICDLSDENSKQYNQESVETSPKGDAKYQGSKETLEFLGG